jgi:hypothetical protein
MDEARSAKQRKAEATQQLHAAIYDEALQEHLSNTVRLEDAGVDCVMVHAPDIMGDLHKFRIRYRMRGKDHEVQHVFSFGPNEAETPARHRLADELVNELARSIARELLAPAFASAMRKLPRL